MTPGEVKGYVRQILLRKDLKDEEKEALSMLLKSFELTMKISPFIERAVKEIENAKNNGTTINATSSTSEAPDPNTGWYGDHISAKGKGPK